METNGQNHVSLTELDAAMALRNAAFAYLNLCDNGDVCSDRSCLRCRIADVAFELERKHGILPMMPECSVKQQGGVEYVASLRAQQVEAERKAVEDDLDAPCDDALRTAVLRIMPYLQEDAHLASPGYAAAIQCIKEALKTVRKEQP